MKERYLESYTNVYGEQWWFDYNKDYDMGYLWGNDSLIEGEIFYIFDGICPPLILNEEEKNWLEKSWQKHTLNKSIYLNLDTEYLIGNNGVYLSNNYCPICLKQKNRFENHHCIPASEGGSDDNVNMLNICKSCHTLITNGCTEDLIPRYLAAFYHQLHIFGIDFYKMNPLNNKRYQNTDTGLLEYRPYIKEVLDFYEKTEERETFNNKLKQVGLYDYKLNRGIAMGFIDKEIILKSA